MERLDISIDDIKIAGYELRDEVSREGIEDLAGSIRKFGVLEPLVVRKKNGGYEIVAGVRRYLACKSIGLLVIPCGVVDASDPEADAITLHENFMREDVGQVDEGRFYWNMMKRHNLKIKDMAVWVHRSVDYVSTRLRTLDWPENIKAALNSKSISFALARELSLFEDPEACKRFLTLAIESGASARVMAGFRVEYDKKMGEGARPAEVVAEEVAAAPFVVPPSPCLGCGDDLSHKPQKFVRLCLDCERAFTFAQRSAQKQDPQAK